MSRSRRLLPAATATTVGLAALAVVFAQGAASAGSPAPDGGPVGGGTGPTASIGALPAQVSNHAAAFVGHTKANKPIRVTFGIKPRNLAAAEQFNAQLQDKTSPLFHHYLSAAQWNKRFGPTRAAEQSVVDWARANHLKVTNRYPNRLLVDVTGTAATLGAAMHMSIDNYSLHGRTLYSNSRAPELPSAISSVVSSVDGLNNFAHLSSAGTDGSQFKSYSAGPVAQLHVSAHANGSKAKLRAALAAKRDANTANITGGSYDPTDLYSSQAYDEAALRSQSSCCNPTHNAGSSTPTTSIAIATAGAHQLSDMQGFQARYSYLAYAYNEYYIDGTPTCCDAEGQMDLEWSTAMSNSFGAFQDTAHVYLYSGVNAQFSTFNDIYNKILTDGHAKIVSSSWGCAEIYCTSDATMNTEHSIFTAMIGQGYTLLNASGDRGAYADCAHVSVSYPASDPNWIGVSATNLELNGSSNYVSETAWPANSSGCAANGGGGGGGCSVKYAVPSWQTGTSGFCGSMRAVPDVSLNGDWFNSPQNLYVNGAWQGNGGTSIAAPEFAGFIAQENSLLLSIGNVCGSGSSACAPLGQGGSKLYLAAQTHGAGGLNPFYDITSGCTTNNIGSGYCGITGYDRATGWGSVNMLQLAWAMSYWSVPEASAPSVAISGPTTGTYFNSGTLSWSVADHGSPAPSGVAGWTAKWDADPGNPTSHSTPGSGDSFYSGPASAHGSTSGSLSLASAGSGCHTLFVRAWDNIGDSSVNTYGPVCYDATAPSTPVGGLASLVTGTQVTAGNKVPVRISWGASSDSGSGLKQYDVSRSIDGGSFVPVGSTTSTHLDVLLDSGHVYQYAESARDNAGNVSSTFTAAKFRVELVNERASTVGYAGAWTGVNVATALNGKLKYTTAHHATAKFTFSGKRVAWVTDVGPARGAASVKLDGRPAVTVSEHASAFAPRTLIYSSMFDGGTHHLVLDNQATAGHPRIDIDAFVVLAPA